MTAVDYLIEQLQAPCRGIPSHIIEQAKEMEKQQILDAWDNGCEDDGIVDNAKQYYNETYGNKGSDEDLIDAINMARNEPDMSGDDIILSIKQSKPTSSQTEILDEEINKKAEEFELTNGIYGFKQGVKWAIEQLKKK